MLANSTPLVPARRTTAPEPCPPELAASALARMKGCAAAIEGIDECAVAFLTGLTAGDVEELVRAWDAGWGFPTTSGLTALKDRLDGHSVMPSTRTARDAA